MENKTTEKAMFGYTPQEYKKFSSHAWRCLLIFSLMYCCFYCIRMNLSNVSPVLIEQLGWTKEDVGILTSVFFWTYGVGQLINGRLSELFGSKQFLTFAVFASIAVNFVFSFQTSLILMAVIWGVNGYVQSMAWPSGISLLAKWWPGDRRGFATGFAFGFSGFGQVIATLAVIMGLNLFPDMGWKSAFIVPAIFPLVMILLLIVFVKSSPAGIGLAEYREENAAKAENEKQLQQLVAEKGKLYPYKHLLTNKKFLVWVLVAFFQGLIRYGLVTWIPLYYVETFGIDVTDGLLQSLALPVGMGVGALVVPTLTDRYCPNNRLTAAVVAGFVAAACIVCFAFLDPRVGVQIIAIGILLFIAGFAIYAVTGCVWAFATDIGGRLFSGTCTGVLDFSQYMGASLQAVLYGFLAERIGWNMVMVSVAAFCVVVAFIGIVNTKKRTA